MKFKIYLILLICPALVKAQKFTGAGIPTAVFQLRNLCVDTVNNKLYSVGLQALDGSSSSSKNTVWEYNGSSWLSLDTVEDITYCCAIYHDELYIGGGCKGVTYSNYLSKWNGTEWEHFGDSISSFIVNMKVINDELYFMGTFTHIGGIDANGIAKWDGTTWSAIYNCPYTNIFDCAFYNGDFYAGGNFDDPSGFVDLAVYKSGTWQQVGGADRLQGGICSLWSMEVYKGELYVGGNISKGEGNVGHGIQKWNGTVWSEVGTGLMDVNHTTMSWASAKKIMQYQNKLYASGTFYYAGDVFTRGLAVWDGNQWCSIDSSFNGYSSAFAFFNDTLYANCGDSAGGIYTNDLAKFNSYSSDSCSINFGISELTQETGISIYPNPNNGSFTIALEKPIHSAEVSVTNTVGQILFNKTYAFQKSVQVDIGQQPSGIYLVSVQSKENRFVTRLVIE